MSRLDEEASDAIGRDLRPAIELFKQIIVGNIDHALGFSLRQLG